MTNKNLGMSKANWKSWFVHTGIAMGTSAAGVLMIALQKPEFRDLLINQFGPETGGLVFTFIGVLLAANFVKKYTDKK